MVVGEPENNPHDTEQCQRCEISRVINFAALNGTNSRDKRILASMWNAYL
jgi:hypothetical protein